MTSFCLEPHDWIFSIMLMKTDGRPNDCDDVVDDGDDEDDVDDDNDISIVIRVMAAAAVLRDFRCYGNPLITPFKRAR